MLSLALLFVGTTAHAAATPPPTIDVNDDWKLTFDGQFRPRLLWSLGKDFVDGGIEPGQVVAQRARLGTTIDRKGKGGPSFTFRLQDARAWGEEVDTLGDYSADGLDVHEAFMRVPLGDGASVKVGRQEIVVDNHRLVGNVGWSTQGRSFDAFRFDYEKTTWQVTAFGVALDPTVKHLLGGLRLHADLAEGHGVSVVALGRTLDPDTRNTVGANLSGKASGLSYTVEGYYQLGEESKESVSAWMGAANVGYTFDNDLAPGAVVRAEVLSGDGTPQGTFDTLYATNHKFYGEMDFFLAIGPNTAFLGLMDLGCQVSVKPQKVTTLSIDVHHFTSMEADAAGETAFGDEIDTKVVYKASKGITLDALYGVYLPGEAMRTVRAIGTDTSLQTEHLFFFTTDFTI